MSFWVGAENGNPAGCFMTSKIFSYSKEELQMLLDNSNGLTPVLRKLGIGGGSSLSTLRKAISFYDLDITKNSLNAKKAFVESSRGRKDLSEILVENSSYTNMERLKIRLLNEGLLEYRCYICGLIDWNGKPISLQLHHINGVHSDNRIENLQFLCPNCHSQTDSWCGNNIKRKFEPVA